MDILPKHIGIIMDGNRRWARERGLPTLEGHKKGYENLKEIGDYCLSLGVQHLTVFGFSTENWKRSPEEVNYLMDLFYDAVTKELGYFKEKKIQLKIVGRKDGLSDRLIQAFAEAEDLTAPDSRGTLALAINYGGRLEILDAVKKIIKDGVNSEDLTEEKFKEFLAVPSDMPDPDLIIRTSGEQRLSGFLTWESVYSEIYFEPKYWPAFTKEDLDGILQWYADRKRRFGGG
ncbi:MAG: polyprenyl diphosphate synthase [bacterium]